MGIAVAVTSGKGGTGKTSLVAAVGSCLAALGHKTLCVDLDIGLRNLDLTLGLSDRALMDFSDVMSGRCPLSRAAAPHPDIPDLFLLTAPLRLDETETLFSEFRAFMEQAKESYDFVLLDAPAGLGLGFQLSACSCDRAIVVSMSDPAALRDAQCAVSALSDTVSSIHLVVNRVRPRMLRRLHTTIDDAMDTAGLPLLGVVPEDKRVTLAQGAGTALALSYTKGALFAYLNIAKRLAGQQVALLRI